MNKHLVLSVGMPRAGSGWYYNLTQDLVVAVGGIDAKKIRLKYRLNHLLTEVNCNIGTLSFYRLLPVMVPVLFEPRYVIKLHAERRLLADLLIRMKLIKPTYIYRDPRDALLSAYEYGQRMSSQGLTNAFTPLRTIDDAIAFMDFYVKIAAGWMSSPHTLKVKYENLLEDYDSEVDRLVDYLEIDRREAEINNIIERYRPGKRSNKSQGTHFVKGVIGRYQEKLTEVQLADCQRLFGDFLTKYGYA